MKVVILCAFTFLAVCQAQLSKEEAIAAAHGCKEETGASDADFEALIKNKSVATKEGKCFLACTFKKFGVISDEGKLVKDAAIEFSKHVIKDKEKKDQAAEVIEACEGLAVSDDACEAVVEYADCVKAEFEKRGISSTEDLIS